MDSKKVLVTGIGGNVGQGILRNIKATGFPIMTVGTNITDFSAGNHLCDTFYKVPYAYEPSYIITMQQIVKNEGVDLIIPATDFEVYYLSENQEVLGCDVAVSEANTAAIYLDKYATYLHHKKHAIPFADSFLPSKYVSTGKPSIAKPKKGRGSRGIVLNPTDFSGFSDEDYMVQELVEGTEITTAFYVNKQQKLHGLITFERILENGTTTHCKVTIDHDAQLEEMINLMISQAHFKGSANVQSIVTKEGKIIPFEINCRISGTNSIRANFGFEDVKYTLQEWLYDQVPSEVKIKKGVATRVLMDVIYTEATNFDQAKDASAKHIIY